MDPLLKIYKAAGLAWEHNKWEEAITRGHFDTSDITLLFRSTCTSVKAPLIQDLEPRLLSQTHTNTVTINYTQNYKTRTEVYLNADEDGLDYTRKDGKKHKTVLGWKQEDSRWRDEDKDNMNLQMAENKSSIHFRLSQNFDV